ncbi:DUF2178 domain-containing protein [Methanosphaerula palustris]|uniref:Uncharacterized protein n=1 Tax=Methanosphaerula palustris (strain ATCC BAA-1556 / DSM 19958 / E1-9c) TaxID=521011 RepID=B8GI53_METPE|nr:DUF2178 domain-containing protein [Methanosphaerula palustris]ACL16793.1 hypothetical protein Mpal_1471 [Methanosphaerula palustris E1-9c]
MKKNGFYLFLGIIAIVLVSIFWYSGEHDRALLMELAFIAAGAIVSYVKVNCTDFTEDERDIIIAGQAMRRTMQVFGVLFCAVSIEGVMRLVPVLSFAYPPPPPIQTMSEFSPRSMGLLQLGLLSDDHSVRRVPVILCQKIRGLGD